MEKVTVDKRGRVTIPKETREQLGLSEEDRLLLVIKGGEIHLKPIVRKQLKVRSGQKWGKEAFLRAREASFAAEK